MSEKMIFKGAVRFQFYLEQLTQLFSSAAIQKNPGLWLYQNNVRTPLFMLESLSKMYSDIHNKKKFTKIKTLFKGLEDVLGAIDYYDNFAKEFAKNKKITPSIIKYLHAQKTDKTNQLNEILVAQNWIGSKNNRLIKIALKLEKIDWLKDKKEINAIKDFYGKAIYDIVEFVQTKNNKFSNIENDVHELRRKLRWLSIYPQALRGSVQLAKPTNTPKHLQKYLTEEITTSPFNKMPDVGDNNYFLLLYQNYFFALSWMIAELGKIKDNGLRIIVIKEALLQTSNTLITDDEATKKAYQILGTKQPKLSTLLDNAEAITKTYFKELNLEHLVVGCVNSED